MKGRETPWLSREAVRFLQEQVASSHAIFEWGSGSSTLWFARRARWVVSVENWPDYYAAVERRLRRASIENVELVLRPADRGSSCKVRDPHAYASNSGGFKHRIFRSYAREIDLHEGLFDLVLVDGRARASCLMHVQAKVQVGGWVVLDDSERGWYRAGMQLYTEPCWKTVVLRGKGNGLTVHAFQRLK